MDFVDKYVILPQIYTSISICLWILQMKLYQLYHITTYHILRYHTIMRIRSIATKGANRSVLKFVRFNILLISFEIRIYSCMYNV